MHSLIPVQPIIIIRKRSCGKVMFLCIPLDTALPPGQTSFLDIPPLYTAPPSRHLARQTSPLDRTPRHPSGDTTTCPGGHSPKADTHRRTRSGPHNPTITAADSTHPTGMHSCLVSSSWNSSRLIITGVNGPLARVRADYYGSTMICDVFMLVTRYLREQSV